MAIRRGLGVVFVVLLGAAIVHAEAPTTKAYDMRDLLVSAPDFLINPPDSVIHTVPATQPSRSIAGEAFATVVRGVLPHTATVRFDITADRLEIIADADGQAAVERLLAENRANHNRQILTEARLLTVDAAVLAALPDPLRTRVAAAALDGGRRPAELTDADVAAVCGSDGITQLVAPRLTTFDGQQAAVIVETQAAYVSALNRITGTDGAVGYEPVVDTLHYGLTLSARERTAADGASVAVDLSCDFDQLVKLETVAQEGGSVQRPQLRKHHFAGLELAPRGKTLLIRAADAKPAAGPQAILLLKATAISVP